jgi:ribosome biogenesis GTPase
MGGNQAFFMNLEALGWDDHWKAIAQPFCLSDGQVGRVVTEDKHAYTLVTSTGAVVGKLTRSFIRHHPKVEDHPKVGDWVIYTPLDKEAKGIIQHILPRRSQIFRKLVGRESARQILATNVEVAFITQGLDQPLNERRLERFLVMAHEGNVDPVVILNKSDVCSDVQGVLAQTRRITGDTPVLVVSALRRTDPGMRALKARLVPGRTHVFIGTSGVGKSSLINRLYGEEIQSTLEVREQDGRGRHATTARELFVLPCGSLVVDTPGMRELHLWEAPTGLDDAFPDIIGLGTGCRFRNCRHDQETGCAIKEAVARGALAQDRYQGFLKLQAELTQLERQRKYSRPATSRRPFSQSSHERKPASHFNRNLADDEPFL